MSDNEHDDDAAADLQRARGANNLRLKGRFEGIFEKYSKDFAGVGDEIDLVTGAIVVDNGHLARMQHEHDAGETDAGQFVKAFAEGLEDEAAEDDGSSDELDETEQDDTDSLIGHDDDPVESINDSDMQALELSNDNISYSESERTSGDTLDNVRMRAIPNTGPHATADNAKRQGMDVWNDIPVLQDTLQSLASSASATSSFDSASIQALGLSIAQQIASFITQATTPKATANGVQDVWKGPDLPRQNPSRVRQSSRYASVLPAPVQAGSPPGQVSLWAAEAVPRKRKRYTFAGATNPPLFDDTLAADVGSQSLVETSSDKRLRRSVTVDLRPTSHGPELQQHSTNAQTPVNQDDVVQASVRTTEDATPQLPARGFRKSLPQLDGDPPIYTANTKRRISPPRSRKRRYEAEEDKLLCSLRNEQRLTWDEIGPYFFERTPFALQVRYSRLRQAQDGSAVPQNAPLTQTEGELSTNTPRNPSQQESHRTQCPFNSPSAPVSQILPSQSSPTTPLSAHRSTPRPDMSYRTPGHETAYPVLEQLQGPVFDAAREARPDSVSHLDRLSSGVQYGAEPELPFRTASAKPDRGWRRKNLDAQQVIRQNSNALAGDPDSIYAKPAHSWVQLVGTALLAAPGERLNLLDIYEYIHRNFPYYEYPGTKWKRFVRVCLSQYKFFEKPAKGKTAGWRIAPSEKDGLLAKLAKPSPRSNGGSSANAKTHDESRVQPSGLDDPADAVEVSQTVEPNGGNMNIDTVPEMKFESEGCVLEPGNIGTNVDPALQLGSEVDTRIQELNKSQTTIDPALQPFSRSNDEAPELGDNEMNIDPALRQHPTKSSSAERGKNVAEEVRSEEGIQNAQSDLAETKIQEEPATQREQGEKLGIVPYTHASPARPVTALDALQSTPNPTDRHDVTPERIIADPLRNGEQPDDQNELTQWMCRQISERDQVEEEATVSATQTADGTTLQTGLGSQPETSISSTNHTTTSSSPAFVKLTNPRRSRNSTPAPRTGFLSKSAMGRTVAGRAVRSSSPAFTRAKSLPRARSSTPVSALRRRVFATVQIHGSTLRTPSKMRTSMAVESLSDDELAM
ncbi:hypothetical protein LTR66_012630 [Elasticomyces elasticus]|nr:hypothetical protein LTR66_012630 [Elasticomyces elasticus]KAK4977308.1 hypothetical protein LTR28_007632 [Elasticomyces elasticus]